MASVMVSKWGLMVLDNDPSTAYGSCQEVLTKNPLAVDGLYYINNNELV